MKLSVGQKAPSFSLFSSEKEKVSLEDFRGRKVLLLFFPQAFTSVCTKELCNVRDNIAAYNNTDAQVLGISVDSVFTLRRYKEDQGLNFPLLSDFNREASEAYDSLYDNWIFEMKGVSKRSAFVIDREGVIQYAEVLDNAGDVPDFQKINETLSSVN
ncbi:MAG: redoxin domain-containing protein [Chitinophagaceae bacterium]